MMAMTDALEAKRLEIVAAATLDDDAKTKIIDLVCERFFAGVSRFCLLTA
jgi:hypothetical protein